MAEIQKQNALREAQEAKRKQEWEKEKKERRAAVMAAKHEREILKKKAEVMVNILKYCLFTSTT